MINRLKQQVLIVTGPDRSGKSTVAKLLSEELKIPYFKYSQDKKALSGSDMTSLMLKIADPYFVEFLKQTGHSTIIDRHYESEWCYSKVLGRQTDEKGVWESDRLFSEIPATILIFKRKSYEGVSDDDPRLNQETLEKLAKQYDEFALRSKCRVLTFEFDKFEPIEMTKTVLKKLKGK
jgi:thymidylate kinase